MNDLKEAVERALAGQWAEAHQIVQKDEQGEVACWIHAVLHRQEGDLRNAGGWYSRAGKEMPGVPLQEEWDQVTKALLM